MGCSKSSSKKEVYSSTILPQVTRKTSNKQPNFTTKTTGKIKTKNYKEMQVLCDTLDEMDVIDTFRPFYPNAEEYTFFSSGYGTFLQDRPHLGTQIKPQ